MRLLAATPAAVGLGASDCERLGDGALAQPINAISSLAYLIVGIGVLVVELRHPPEARIVGWPQALFGWCLIAIGIGSVLFHGPQPAGSRMAHDVPIVLTVVLMVTIDVARLWPTRTPRPGCTTGGLVAATVLTIVAPDVAIVAAGIGVAVVIGLEVMVHRKAPTGSGVGGVPSALVVVLALIAGSSWLLGRTDGPVCNPESIWQLHALWHVVTAALLGIWWRSTRVS